MRDGWEDYRMLAALRDGGRQEMVEKLIEGYRAGKPPADLRHQALEPLLPKELGPGQASERTDVGEHKTPSNPTRK
jgi:hypothetical protein